MENKLTVIEYNNKRILTTKQLAEVYETAENNIKNNFNNNKDRFIEGKHYYILTGEELKQFILQVKEIDLQISNKTRTLYLWTERGASRHCKILDTDKAWEQFDNLEETYFKSKHSYQIEDPIERAKQWIKEQEQKKLLEEKIQEQQPKVEYYENVLNPTDFKKLITVTQIAKDLCATATRLNEKLKDLGIQYKQSKTWFLNKQYEYLIKEEYADYTINDFGQTLKWTEKGRKFIIDKLEENNYLNDDGTLK